MMDLVDVLWNTLSLVVAFIVLQQMFRLFGHDGLPIRRWLVPNQPSMQQNKETQTGLGAGRILRREAETQTGLGTGSILRREAECIEGDDATRIVLIGETGTGKSSTGNTLLGKTTGNGGFKAETSMNAVTADCESKAVEINGEKLMVVDTPGVFDAIRPAREMRHIITRCLFMCGRGPHALLFVVKATERFTREQYDAYYRLKEMFGSNVADYIICVFTQGDQLDGKGMEDVLEEFRREIDQQKQASPFGLQKFADIRDILKDISDRYVVISNKGDDATKDAQVRVLLDEIHKLKKHNEASPVFYSFAARSLWLIQEFALLNCKEKENLDDQQAWAKLKHRLCQRGENDRLIHEMKRLLDDQSFCIVM